MLNCETSVPTKRPRVMFTCNDATKDYLDDWAKAENRTISNLVETLVVEAITAREAQKEPPTSPPSKRRDKAGGKE